MMLLGCEFLFVLVASSEGGVVAQSNLDYFKIIMGALAGLVLFIYGVTRLAQGLEFVAGERMKNLVGRFTSNRFAGVLTGAAATTLLESSSVTIIMVIAMVSAGVMSFVRSLGVVLGSNIGTTIGAQLISLEINLYAPILMGTGALLHFISRDYFKKNVGLVLIL
jgi:phosphate:Na+ symporter